MGQTKGRFLLRFTVLFIGLEVIATVLTVYAQSFAYYFSDFGDLSARAALTLFTLLSIGTFLVTYWVILSAEKKRTDINFFAYLMVNGLYGFFVSLVAVFILAMGWG